LRTGYAVATGRAIGGGEMARQPAAPWMQADYLRPTLQALGLIDDQGRTNPRMLAVVNNLLPMTSLGLRGGLGGLTAAQAEQNKTALASGLIGQGVYLSTPRQRGAALRSQGNIIDQLVPTRKRPKQSEVTRRARVAELLARLGYEGP
jgi:hypothetical protein